MRLHVEIACPACGEVFMVPVRDSFGPPAFRGQIPVTLTPDESRLQDITDHISDEHPLWPDDPGMNPDDPKVIR